MKPINIFCALLCLSSCLYSQNFAPNPSFEIATGCVTGNGWTNVNSWRVPTSHTGSPDRFHTCAPGTFGVTANVFGDQAARTGSSYIGFVSHFGSNGLFREYLQAPLTSALVPGQSYTVSAYISLSDGSGWATDGYGFHFAIGAIAGTGGQGPLPFTPQVSCPTNTFMNDKIGWQLLSGNFVAASAFTHITFGNFKTDAATNIQVQGSGWTWNYTYLDDISVTPSVILTAEMGEFAGEMRDNKAELAWDTRSETGTRHFAVERSIGDFEHFESIGTAMATGSPTTAAQYHFTDPNPSHGQLNYYRIQEVDQDGNGGYSQTIELHTDALVNEVKFLAWPSPVPAGQSLQLDIHSTKHQSLTLEVMDMNGRLLSTQPLAVVAGPGHHTLDTGALASGCYLLRLTGKDVHLHQKFIVAANQD